MGLINIGAKLLAQGAKAASHSAPAAKAVVTEGLEGGAKIVDKVHLQGAAAVADHPQSFTGALQQAQIRKNAEKMEARMREQQAQASKELQAQFSRQLQGSLSLPLGGEVARTPAQPGMEMLRRMQQQGGSAASQMDVKL